MRTEREVREAFEMLGDAVTYQSDKIHHAQGRFVDLASDEHDALMAWFKEIEETLPRWLIAKNPDHHQHEKNTERISALHRALGWVLLQEDYRLE